MSFRLRFKKFEAVAPGIFGVESADARNGAVVGDFDAASAESFPQFVEVGSSKGGMRLFGGTKILFDADMELLGTAPEPAATTGAKRFWFFNLAHAKESAIKIASGGLAAFGGGDLHVIKPCNS